LPEESALRAGEDTHAPYRGFDGSGIHIIPVIITPIYFDGV